MGTGAKVAIALVGVAILAGAGYWIYTMQKPKDAPTGGTGGTGIGGGTGAGTGNSGSNTLDVTPIDEQPKLVCPSGMSMRGGKCVCPHGRMPSASGCVPCPKINGIPKCAI